MLKALTIQNYALIKSLQIEFFNDFSIVTGETGAGKSILLGALALVTGSRADTSVLNDEEQKCFVEATFSISEYNLKHLFEELELDYDDETILRREISNSGKSRAFINDMPVSLNQMKALGDQLIDIHSQHQNLNLNDNRFQLEVIDTIARVNLTDYQQKFRQWNSTRKEIELLTAQAEQWQKDYDYNVFQYQQLKELNLDKLNLKEMEEELQTLVHAETIQLNLGSSYKILQDDDVNIVGQLVQVKQHLNQIRKFFPKSEAYLDRVEQNLIDLKDLATEIEVQADGIVYEPERIVKLKNILDAIYNQLQKHRVETISELITLQESFGELVAKSENFEHDLKLATQKLELEQKAMHDAAKSVSAQRQKALKPFGEKIATLLKELGMPDATFTVNIESGKPYSLTGVDEIQFLFSANRNFAPQEISKIASGGEISRLMLSIKCELSASKALPTIIFDEIDTGVSGDIAGKMASIMKQMAGNMQVLSITHLPQIAAKGKNHYWVFKSSNGDGVTTKIKLLSQEERVQEIAKMLSGENITPEAVSNAKALLN